MIVPLFFGSLATSMALLAILQALNGDSGNAKAAIVLGVLYAAAYFWWTRTEPVDNAP